MPEARAPVAGSKGAVADFVERGALWFVGRHSLPRCLSALFVVVVLVSATVILEHCHVFEPVDDIALTLALRGGSMLGLPPGGKGETFDTPPQDARHPRLATVLVSETMFEHEMDRRLPLDATLFARLIEQIAALGPQALAIDIDIANLPQGITQPSDEQMQTAPVTLAVQAALERGIDVFAISYPRATKDGRTERNRYLRTLCELPRKDAQGPTGLGKLRIVSPQIKTLGARLSAIDIPHFDPAAGSRPVSLGIALACTPSCKAGDDGRGISSWCKDVIKNMESDIRSADRPYEWKNYCADRPYEWNDYCPGLNELDDKITGIDDEGKIADFESTEEVLHARDLINFKAQPAPYEVSLETSGDIKVFENRIKGNRVIVGLQSFAGIDEFLSPIGRLPGPVVHAYIAASMQYGTLRASHPKAALADFILGCLFSGLALFSHRLITECKRVAPNFAGMALFVSLPVLLLLFSALVLLAMPTILRWGVWLNPIPMLLGLTAHAYTEAIESGDEAHHAHAQAPAGDHDVTESAPVTVTVSAPTPVTAPVIVTVTAPGIPPVPVPKCVMRMDMGVGALGRVFAIVLVLYAATLLIKEVIGH